MTTPLPAPTASRWAWTITAATLAVGVALVAVVLSPLDLGTRLTLVRSVAGVWFVGVCAVAVAVRVRGRSLASAGRTAWLALMVSLAWVTMLGIWFAIPVSDRLAPLAGLLTCTGTALVLGVWFLVLDRRAARALRPADARG